MAVVLLALGFQLIGGSLHAASASHDPASDCQICIVLDRLDPAVTALDGAPVCSRADTIVTASERPSIPSQAFRAYTVRAPPAIRRS